MKINLYTFKTYISLIFLMSTALGHTQIVLNTTPNIATCNLSGSDVTISVPTEVLTGDNIALNITLPGSFDAGCTKTVTITKSSNLNFQSSGSILFSTVGGNPNSFSNDTVLPGNEGQNFNIFFKFPPYVTCNGTSGTFDVTVTANCGGVETTCTTSVNIIARAANYWTISKQFMTGNLTCGISNWRIRLTHNNPNGIGLGDYKITGTISESTSMIVPIITGASYTVNNTGFYNSSWIYPVTLQNCAPDGTTITNSADYNFTLGNNCESMTGTVTAVSDTLVSPNADLSFTKRVIDHNNFFKNHPDFNIAPSCFGRYQIRIHNNGNVPFTNLSITDNLNIPEITLSTTPFQLPSSWTSSNSGGLYTFTPPTGFVLNPGETRNIYIPFQVNSSVVPGTSITNTATISYQGSNNGGSSPGSPQTACPGINCPTIDTTIQNKTITENFIVDTIIAVPSIKKCIINPPNSMNPPIYQIGDNIEFSLMVGNSGSANLSTVVNDALGIPGQNLQIIPGSITYGYYPNENYYIKNICNPTFSGSVISPPPFSVVSDTLDLKNPFWTISNMPGTCDYYKSNFLIINYIAKILPQTYGSKTNKASISSKESQVNYAIDQVGILGVFKTADTQIADSGQTFNYNIKVLNNGSVPLDNIIVTDLIPSCVSLQSGHITVENSMGIPITSTTTGNAVITLNPSAQIQPGDYFTITVPVVKLGSGNCCNESVSVTANMTTTGVELNANYGSSDAPAACVSSAECCDIPNFEASLIENNGNFSVNIDGGAVPIQEVEITMMDYHVDYSNKDCKPDDMGNFGTLSSSTTNLQTLLLNTNDNNTSSLTWLPGSPAVINSNIQLDIVDPLTLNLDCCKVTYSFCLKVRVKDVNCNVCEKIICYTPPEPTCDIKLDNKGVKKKYCIGDTIPISWTGTSPSGLVNLYLIDKTNWVTYQTIATGLPDTGSYNFTIPTNIPCKPIRSWQFYIEDSQKNCYNYGSSFVIDCCQQTQCDCGKWKTNFVTINEKIKPINTPKIKNPLPPYIGLKVTCGDTIRLKAFSFFSFKAPVYNCATANCSASYKWKLIKQNGKVKSGTGKTFSHNFNTYGIYKIVFTPSCGSKACASCQINVIVEKKVSIGPNNNPGDYIGNQYKGEVTNPKTGRTWMDRNLGASRVATSSTDAAAFGDLYQWGRLTDGHEKRTSSTTTILSNNDVPGHGKFIVSTLYPRDWRVPKNNNLWQGVNAVNNPCPSGYRIPTANELNDERLSWITNDATGAFASPLKWTLGGNRYYNQISGLIYSQGIKGSYWSADVNGFKAQYLWINISNASVNQSFERGSGASVRCIKD